MFLFLPQLLFNRHMAGVLPEQMLKGDRLVGDMLSLALLIIVSLIGQLVVISVIANDGTAGRTLGQLLKQAIRLLPAGLAISLMQGLAAGFGLLLFILPGIYLMARFLLALPLLVTENLHPVAALKQSWRLTKGHVLRTISMFAILVLGFSLVVISVSGLGAAFGVVSALVAGAPTEGWGIARWLYELFSAGISAGLSVLYIGFFALLMRSLQMQPRENPDAA